MQPTVSQIIAGLVVVVAIVFVAIGRDPKRGEHRRDDGVAIILRPTAG